jgi:hypothetical protein
LKQEPFHHESSRALEARARTNKPKWELEGKLPPFSFWFCCSKKGDNNFLCFGFVVTKKAKTIATITFIIIIIITMKKAIARTVVAFFFLVLLQ